MVAYFDESGTGDDSPYLCMAGYIFEQDNIIGLEAAWEQMLAKYELPYFHMSECAHHIGIYSHLTSAQCDSAAREAIELVKTYAAQGIAISMEKAAMRLLPPNGLWENTYSFICGQVLYGVRDWAKKVGFTGDVDYVFESGAHGRGQAAEAMKKVMEIDTEKRQFRLASHAFLEKSQAAGLQCADLLAWHWLKHNRRLAAGQSKRADFKNLIGLRIDPHHYDEEAIRLWLLYCSKA